MTRRPRELDLATQVDADVAPAATPSVLRVRITPQRWLALDILRGLAVLLMIQGHTFTALLRPSEFEGTWSQWHSLLHGLTAPMFLIGGGLAYGFVVMRDTQQPGMRLVRRGLMLLVLGYILQFPNASPATWLHNPTLLAGALRVGPLQLIGACLLICESIRAVTRTRMQLMATVCLQALMIALSAPVVWKVRASQGALLPLGTWFDGYAGSLFPFFPWAVFFLLGVIVSFGVLTVLETQAPMRLERLAAVTMLAIGVLATSLTYGAFIHGRVLNSWYGEHELWHTSPLYVVFRAGAVLAGLGLLWVIEPWLRRRWRDNGPIETLLRAISHHSLVAYVVHLLVLYGTPFTKGLVHDGAIMSVWEASTISALLITFTLGVVLAWQRIQRMRALRTVAA